MRMTAFRKAIRNLWRNRMMSFASITSVAATLVILGIIVILILNINALTEGLRDQFDTVTVFLDEELERDQIVEIGNRIESIGGIEGIIFETKEQSLENMKEEWGDNSYLLDLEENPLPNSYIVTVTDIEFMDSVVEQIAKIDGIEDIAYVKDIVETVVRVTSVIRNAGLVLILLLLAISTLIINNTVKLAINARRKEIFIMRYVGATSWFIRWPFIIEGIILGIIGALITTAILYYGYSKLYASFDQNYLSILIAYLVDKKVVTGNILYLNMVIGAGIGALGSIMSMKRYLKV